VPIYDYVCRNCGHTVEVIHGVNAEGPSECPVCGGPMRRALSAPTVHFKGSGWAKKERSAARSAQSSGDSGQSRDGGQDAAKTGGETAKTTDQTAKPAAEAAPSAAAESSKSAGSASEGT
jgi:putative FmdB family regulatory protein